MIYRYRFISEHRATYGVKRLCQVPGLRRQGFHEWVAAEQARAARAETDAELVRLIAGIHAEHRGAYGVPRITAELHRRGHTVNHRRVERLMREGHAMAEHMRTDLVCDAVDLATARGLITPEAVFHSDRGVQYTSGQFRTALAEHKIRPSVGRVGSCYDNAVAEAFFATLKTEIGVSIWRTRSEARQEVFCYLRYYNHSRLHSTVGQNTPAETRTAYYAQAPAA
jgi:transposase InsO family protein